MRQVSGAVNYKTDIADINSAPVKGNFNDIKTAFQGDLGNVFMVTGRTINGTDTLGAPTVGYVNNPECSSVVGYVKNLSGHNEATASNAGRTSGHFGYLKLDNYGQGDLSGFTIFGFVASSRAGATSFLANPAISMVNGTFTAGAHGVYLNPFEVDLELQTYDAAAVGYVSRVTRNTGDTANGLGAVCGGFRGMSNGTYAADWCINAYGLHKAFIDGTTVTLTSDNCFAAMKTGQRIYGNATSSDGLKATSYGTDWIERNTSGWDHYFGSVRALRIGIGLTVPETAASSITSPASGYQVLFIDTADHKLKRKDSSGTVTTIA